MKKLPQLYSLMAAVFGLALAGHAQTNIIENMTNWPTGTAAILATNTQQNLPTSSAWYTGTKSQFNGTNGTLVASPIPAGSSMTWWTYFAPSNAPVKLSPSNSLQLTVNFTVYGSVAQNTNRHLRVGLLYSGPNQWTVGGNATETGVSGYVQQMNCGTTFGLAPFSLAAATNVASTSSILSKSADLLSFAHSGGGTTNDPGLVDGVPYTLIMTVTEDSSNSVDITTTILGTNFANGTNITFTETDTNFCYTNFDTLCLRPNQGTTTATNFTFSSFKVETFPVSSPTAGPIQISSVQKPAPGSVVLTWTSTPGFTYSVYRTNVLSGGIATWPTIVTGYPTGGAAGSSLSYTDTTATATSGFYRVSSP